MSFYDQVIKPILFRFDPESVHNLAIKAISTGLVGEWRYENSILRQELMGQPFYNPLGLAAGFDKDGAALGHWRHFGFGFVEAGTITFYPQPGNPRPRLFRFPEKYALVNRMGFNNAGAEGFAAAARGIHSPIPVGINLGKSKVTELRDAAQDYRQSFEILQELGAYFVINVSSPNTPGLRTLQERGPLLEIITAMQEVNSRVPLFVKVAPDLEFEALDEVIKVVHEAKLAGMIATNTTISRPGMTDPGIDGGLSGAPLYPLANQFLSHLYQSCEREKILIGVGGIFDGDDLFEKISLGAHLCQVYTGWVYGGPAMVPRSLRRLVQLMQQRGFNSISQVRGSAYR